MSLEGNGTSRKISVCLMGATLDTQNMGVSALAASLIKIFHETEDAVHITILTGVKSNKPQELVLQDKKISVEVANYRLSPKARFNEHLFVIFALACIYRCLPIGFVRKWILKKNTWLRTLHDADVIADVRGGDSFSDIYGLGKMIIGTMPSLTALFLKKELTLLPQTYGPYKSAFSRIIARFILNRATMILSRDRYSIESLKELLGKAYSDKNIKYCPDVAFTLDAILPDKVAIEPELLEGNENLLIGFNVNGLMYNGGYTRRNMFGLKLDYRLLVPELIELITSRTNASILLIPHTFGEKGSVNSDSEAIETVLKMLRPDTIRRTKVVKGKYNQNELKAIIGECDFFIGSRLHSCIASISQGIPTIGVAYSKKFIGVFDSAGIRDTVVDGRIMDNDSACRMIMKSYEERTAIANNINKKIAVVKEQIYSIFMELTRE